MKVDRMFIPFFLVLLISNSQITSKSCTRHEKMEIGSVNDSLVLEKIMQVDKRKYIGLVVDSFFHDETFSKFTFYVFNDHPVGVLSSLIVKYAPKVSIRLYLKEYRYVIQESNKRDWKIEDFKKENLYMIEVYHGSKMVEQVFK